MVPSSFITYYADLQNIEPMNGECFAYILFTFKCEQNAGKKSAQITVNKQIFL